jgi:hypothetical protein
LIEAGERWSSELTGVRRLYIAADRCISEVSMADGSAKSEGPDRTRVNIHEPFEVAYWAMKWNVGAEKLKAAVAQVGPLVDDVAKALGKRAPPRMP